MSTFSGFISRYMKPALCKYSIPSKIWIKHTRASDSVIHFMCFRRQKSQPPGQYYMMNMQNSRLQMNQQVRTRKGEFSFRLIQRQFSSRSQFRSYFLLLSMNLAARNCPSIFDRTKNTLLKPPIARQQQILNFYKPFLSSSLQNNFSSISFCSQPIPI